MIKQWKDIKVGDKMKDGSIVTQVHRTHKEDCCKLTYENDREMICAYRHIFLVDVSNLPIEGKQELEQNCTFVPLEESFEVNSDYILTPQEADIVESFCRNEPIKIKVDCIQDGEIEIYDFHFPLMTKRISLKQVIVKSEPQKVDENTYWLTCTGIEYLMNKYKVDLYCNDLILNKIEPMGKLDCFCISTNTGKYET